MIFICKMILLTIILVMCYSIATFVSGMSSLPAGSETGPDSTRGVMTALLINAFLQTLVLSYVILRSRWRSWKLMGALLMAFYGSHTVIAQIESMTYLPRQLPPGMVSRLFVMGAVLTLLFTPLAVLILGKMRRAALAEAEHPRSAMTKNEWTWKLILIAAVYLFLYYFFGYFVAWKNPAVQAYYGGTDPGNLLAQLAAIFRTTPWMFPFQMLRAFLWVVLVLPMTRMLKGNSWEKAFAMACFFAIWSFMLLIPNPYMPAEVARTHLIETVLADFIFGWVLGWLLSRHHSSFQELFRTKECDRNAELA